MTNARLFGAWITGLLMLAIGCSGDSRSSSEGEGESLGQSQQALSSSQERVFQFEAPTNDWTTSAGTLSASSVVAQGSAALAVNRPQAWTEVCSTKLTSLGSVGTSLSVQLLQQATPSFGTVQLFVRIPSLGHWNTPIQPPISLTNKAPGVFHTLAFPLGTVASALSGTYSDLTLCFAINASAGLYVLDDLRFSGLTTAASSTVTTTTTGTTSSGTGGMGGTGASTGTGTSSSTGGGSSGTGASGGTGGTAGTGGDGDLSHCVPATSTWDRLVLRFPRGVSLDDIPLSAQVGSLDIHDGVAVRTGDGTGFAGVSSLGDAAELTELGAGTETGDVYSVSPVYLRSNAIVHGFVKSGGVVSQQTGADVEQATLEDFDHQPYEVFEIPYQFPAAYNPVPGVITNGATVTLAPGGYGNVSVQAQSRLKLRAGTYTFESLNFEPGTFLQLDNAAGGISIFIRGAFKLKVVPTYAAPNKYNVLFAVTGVGPIALEKNFRGTLIAPNADVTLPTATISLGHHGSIHARSITAHQHTDFYHHTYQRDAADCASVDPEGLGGFAGCPARDTDDDGLSDCYENNDDTDWTDPEVFNGLSVSLAEPCHSGSSLLHADVDTREEIEGCLESASGMESQPSRGGAFWPPPGGADFCSPDYGLGIEWMECRDVGQAHFRGVLNVTEAKTYCFQVQDGSSASEPNLALGALLLDEDVLVDPILATDGAVCVEPPIGVLRLHWLYEFLGHPDTGFRVAVCTTASGSTCDPLASPADWTRNDREDHDPDLTLRLPCAEDDCALQCPCDSGEGTCESECEAGHVCGKDNGGHFGLSKTADVCWAEGCSADAYATGCGSDNAPCGVCFPIPNACTDDADCTTGEVCGESNGLDFGLSASDRLCWPERCEGVPGPSDVGSLSSPCGVGLCRPSCEGKQCGDQDGCGGYCPLCTPSNVIEGGCADDQQCAPGYECAFNEVCVSASCQDHAFFEANCGEGELCGPCPACEDGCGNAECGVDPRCGGECGEGACADGLSCVAGQCVNQPEQQEPDPASTVGRLEGTFSVTPNGAATYSIPISVPPGRAGLAPKLSVEYTSGKEDGILGLGWKLAGLPSIARCPASTAQSNDWGHPVRLDGDDRFCIGEELLVAEDAQADYGENGTYYRTERETFVRFRAFGPEEVNGSYWGPQGFVAQTKDGLEYEYGITDEASVFVQPRSNRVKRAWALNEIRDRSGNSIQVRYRDTYDSATDSETFELLPYSIRYAPDDREVRFGYEPRSETRIQYTTGARIHHTQRLANIQTVVGDRITRSYEFVYEEPNAASPLTRPLLLIEVRECVMEGATKHCKNGTGFNYENVLGLVATTAPATLASTAKAVMDLNGDGMDDLIRFHEVGLATGNRQAPFESRTTPNTNYELFEEDLQSRVLDYDGDGVDEFVHAQDYRTPLSIHRWDGEDIVEVYRTPETGDHGIFTIKTVDLNGDGLKDIYTCGGTNSSEMRIWMSERNGGTVSYSQFPGSISDPIDPRWCLAERMLFLDVDGDGVANVVRHEVPSGNWYYLGHLPDFNGRWVPLRIVPRLGVATTVQVGLSTFTNEAYGNTLGVVDPRNPSFNQYEPLSLRVGNANGDRLVDLFEHSPWGIITWTAFGGGFKFNSGPDPYAVSSRHWAEASVVDYDGDGRDDLILDGRVYQATDKGLVETALEGIEPGSMVGDFDGDGTQDYLTQPTGADPDLQSIHYGNTRTSFSLIVVRDGLGLEHEIKYDRFDGDGQPTYVADTAACAGSETYCIKKPPPLVSAVQIWESRLGPGYEQRVLQEFHYKDLRRGVDGRGSYGMGERVVSTYGPDRVLSSEVREVYHNDSFELAGVLKSRETHTDVVEPTRVAAGHSRRVTEDTEWQVRLSDAERPFPFPAETYTVVEDEDANGGMHELYHVTVTRDADVYGNLTRVETIAGDPRIVNNPAVIRRSAVTVNYEHETDASRVEDWLIALPSHRSENASRSEFLSPEREMDFTYDEDGLLETATRLGSGSEYQQTTLVRDQYGNVELSIVRDAEGNERQQRVDYDSRGLFPIQLINAEGETTGVRVNEALGSPDEITDPNGLSERLYYDGFGRVTRVEGWEGDVDYLYSDPAFGPGALDPASDNDLAKQRVTVTTSHGARAYTDTDAFGRTVLSITRGLFDAEVVQAFVYDWDGTLMRESRPHENGDFTQGVIEYEYDSWHRLTATHFPDSTSIQHYYATAPTYAGSGAGLPASGDLFELRRGIFAEFVTKRGNTNSTLPIDGGIATDHLGVTQTASDATATLTSFRYSEFDLLDRIDHVRGNGGAANVITWMLYDLWGRARFIEDPDAGRSFFTYTGFDEVDTVTDAEGIVSSFDYDNMGRLTERRDTEDGESLVTTWSYGDSAASNNIGRVTEARSPDGIVTEYFYKGDGDTAAGLPDRVRTSVPRTQGSSDMERFTQQFLYDSLKRAQAIVYPSAAGETFSVELTRDEGGHVTGVRDGADAAMVYWEATQDYQGIAVSQERLGNGVYTNSTFDDSTGYILGIQSQIGPQAYSPGDLIQDLAYGYTKSGLLETRTDAALSEGTRTYGYDALDRLKSTFVGIGGFVNWYDYDQLGNLTLKDDQTLAYDRPDGLLPHAVRAMGDNLYEYDGKGNQTLRTGPDVAGERQRVRYTPFNLPKQIDTGSEASPDVTTFEYDAGQTRTVKRTASATTLFVGGDYERVEPHDTSGERTHKYHVFAGGRRVAQVTRTEDIAFESLGPPEYEFLSRERLGSVHTVTAVDGSVIEQRNYEPFGAASDEALASGDIRAGFTGHEHDVELGLIDMGGRVYDPALGRFLTPDPLANVFDLQSLNRYSYVLNSPLNLVDPTGFQGGPPPGGIPSGSSGGNYGGWHQEPISGPNGGPPIMTWVQDYEVAEAPAAPQDLGHADPSESGTGPSQTTPQPATPMGSESSAPGKGDAPQPAASAATPPTPAQATSPISNPGPVTTSGGRPAEGGARQAPSGAEPGRGTGQGGGGQGGSGSSSNLAIFAEATTQIRDTSAFWDTALQVATAITPGPGMGEGLLGLGVRAWSWVGARGAARAAASAGAGSLDEVARAVAGAICFTGDTLVLMADGSTKAIEDVEVGDVILSDDPEDMDGPRARTVTDVYRTATQQVFHIGVAGEESDDIKTTGNHPFWTGRGWVLAKALTVDDVLVDDIGDNVTIDSIGVESLDTPTFNLNVERDHTYFVVAGDTPLLVHNQSEPVAAGLWYTQMVRPDATTVVDALFYDVARPYLSEGAWSHVQALALTNKTSVLREAAPYFSEGARHKIGTELLARLIKVNPDIASWLISTCG